MEESKYYELWCGDGDYYHLTEKAKLELDQYLKENDVTYRDIGVDVIPVKLMDHIPSMIDFYIEEFKKKMKENKYPPKGEIWEGNVVFKADKDFWGTDTLKDLAYCSWSEKDNCYVFHTMAYGWIHEDSIISFERIDTNAKV